MDPPRPEVKDAVMQCQKAGIGVMIITGDHPETARAVAKQIGLYREGDVVLTGADIDRFSQEELDRRICSVRIIARALPLQKLKVVDALKKRGELVAMTGDGVNDAPALKKADIGVAMGITGSEVAKEVSKAVLSDDNFATIVNAIEEGRTIYDKIIKSTKYLLSCNIGEIFTVMTAILSGLALPLLPMQILLMNLITDGVPALGLGLESSESNVMDRPPRRTTNNPLTAHTYGVIITFGLVMAIGTIFLFRLYLPDLPRAQTIAFTVLVMFEMFAVVSCRSFRAFRKMNPFTNLWLSGGVALSIAIQVAVIYLPPLQAVFGTVPISLLDWARIMGVSSIGFFVMEGIKLLVPSEAKYSQDERGMECRLVNLQQN
jgi:Ca2+-transporting ATPase